MEPSEKIFCGRGLHHYELVGNIFHPSRPDYNIVNVLNLSKNIIKSMGEISIVRYIVTTVVPQKIDFEVIEIRYYPS